MKRFLFWLTLYVALLGGSYMLYHLVLPIRVSFHILIPLALVAYLYKRGLPSSPLAVGGLLMLVAVGVSILGAVDSRMALENGWSWLVNLLLLLALVQLCRDGYAPILFKAHFAAGGVVAAVALLQYLASGQRPGGWFDNINFTGAYAAALVIPALHTAWELKGRERWLYSLLSVALVSTVFLTDSRGGMVSVGVAALVYISFRWQTTLSRKLGLWVVALGMVSIPLWIISQAPRHALGDIERMDLWRSAGEMIQTMPTGSGPGLFAQVYREIGNSGENRFTGAHNEYLTLGAELGAVGLAAGAALVLMALYYLVNLDLSPSQVAALAALCGIAAHLAVDNYPSTNWALLVALYVAYVMHEAKLPPLGRWLQLGSALTALLLMGWTIRLLQFDRAQVAYEEALRTGRFGAAYEALELDPDNKLYQLEVDRLEGKDVSNLDSNLALYALTMYGRIYR